MKWINNPYKTSLIFIVIPSVVGTYYNHRLVCISTYRLVCNKNTQYNHAHARFPK